MIVWNENRLLSNNILMLILVHYVSSNSTCVIYSFLHMDGLVAGLTSVSVVSFLRVVYWYQLTINLKTINNYSSNYNNSIKDRQLWIYLSYYLNPSSRLIQNVFAIIWVLLQESIFHRNAHQLMIDGKVMDVVDVLSLMHLWYWWSIEDIIVIVVVWGLWSIIGLINYRD